MAEVNIGRELRDKYPPNKAGEQRGMALATGQKPIVEKVVTGKTKRTKSLGRKLADVFLGADVTDVKSFLIWDCLVPGVKYAFLDSLLMLFGERGYRGSGGSIRGGGSGGRGTYVSYGSYSRGDSGRDRETRKTGQSSSSRYSPDDVVFESKEDAERVLDILCDYIEEYGEASVAAFYGAADISSDDFTDNYWGWRDLTRATTRRVRDGWIVVMPKVEYLK